MPLKTSDIEFKAKLPELPSSVPVFAVSAPSFTDRRTAIGRLGELFKLGDMKTAELDHAIVMGNERGDIHYFHASGAVLARDAAAAREQKSELRKWEGTQDSKKGGQRITLSPEASKRLIGQAQQVLDPIGLLGKERASATVTLDQVAQLDAKGKERSYGAGSATVKFGYAVEGLPVRGAGAKTLAFADPAGTGGGVRFTGAFHAWRSIGKASAVKLPGLEASLAVGLLGDPELDLYHQAGHRVTVTKIDFGYVALPAFMRQSHLIPMFEIQGQVSEGKKGIAFGFGRFHHAIPPANYAAADVYGPYLTVNPDGITPLRQPQTQK